MGNSKGVSSAIRMLQADKADVHALVFGGWQNLTFFNRGVFWELEPTVTPIEPEDWELEW